MPRYWNIKNPANRAVMRIDGNKALELVNGLEPPTCALRMRFENAISRLYYAVSLLF